MIYEYNINNIRISCNIRPANFSVVMIIPFDDKCRYVRRDSYSRLLANRSTHTDCGPNAHRILIINNWMERTGTHLLYDILITAR